LAAGTSRSANTVVLADARIGTLTGKIRQSSEKEENSMWPVMNLGFGLCRPIAFSSLAVLVIMADLPALARAPLFDESRGVLTIAPMLEQVTPAVVNIAVTARVTEQENPLFKDPFFRRFFGLPDDARPRERRSLAAGSGVIIDAGKGLIVTNHHVIKDAETIAVTLKDGRQIKADLVGSDAGTEIALLRIAASGLTSIPLGDSDGLRVGDVVLAIGNPFGVGQTVTSGIVSALGRSGLTADNYEDFIQTDAPINPGNSGGALVNSRGQLIGINTAIIAPAGGNVGIGFAVPVNMVKTVTAQLERHGRVNRGRIGVAVQSVTPDIAAAAGLAQAQGAIISSVEKNSPAERAGLQAGDVIIEIDGKPVLSASDVRNRIGLRESGSRVTLGYLREGKSHRLTLQTAPPQ
jgi:Do/DeqQ family serine protease